MGIGRSLLVALLGSLLVAAAEPGPDASLRLVQSIALPDVKGRIDHMAVDPAGERLFVAALGNNTVEVLSLQTGKNIRSIRGLHEPQGVAFAGISNHLFVTNGETGSLEIYDGSTLEQAGSIPLSEDADNVRYDPADDRAYIGYGSGRLVTVDATRGREIESIRLEAHPESFELEHDGRRIFVNVPSAGHIAVIDRDSARVVATWPLVRARGNFPMALDEREHRLFIGCREPTCLLVYDTTTGVEVYRVPIDGDADDMFWDAARMRIYVSCGAGDIDIVQQASPDSYSVVARIPTAAGARTCLFVSDLNRLFLAVPQRGRERAEVRVYAVGQ